MKFYRTPIAAALCTVVLAASPLASAQEQKPFDDNKVTTFDRSSTPGSGGPYSGPEFKDNLGYSQDEGRRLQQALSAKGFDVGPIDGVIGPRTRAALRAYQEQNKLAGAGRFDRETATSLGLSDFDDNTVQAMDMSSTPGSRGPYSGPVWKKPDPSQIGTGAASNLTDAATDVRSISGAETVRQLQQALRERGFDPGPVDGVMGQQTRTALMEYQRQNNLTASGRLDRETVTALGWPQLRDFDDNKVTTIDMSSTPGSGGEYSGPSRRSPVGGWSWANDVNTVRNVQQALASRGFYTGPIDGVMGPQTQAGLDRFQQQEKTLATANDRDQQVLILLGVVPVQQGAVAAGAADSGSSAGGGVPTPGGAGGR